MGSRSRILLLLVCLGLVTASAALAQTTPTITSLESSRVPQGNPAHGDAITIGTPFDFYLFINGDFDVEFFHRVLWTDIRTNPPTTVIECNQDNGDAIAFARLQPRNGYDCDIVNVTSSLLVVRIRQNLFSESALSRVTINVRVVEFPFDGPSRQSNIANFFLNPPIVNRPMPPGSVGTAYAQPLIDGGTAPFQVSLPAPSLLPPGMTVPQNDPTLRGTPTTEGTFTFPYEIRDAWQNLFEADAAIRIFSPPVLSSLSPPSRLAAMGDSQLTATGSNFSNEEGNESRIVFGGAVLATTFVNSTTLRATVSGVLVMNPATIPVLVRNGGSRDSNVVNFSVLQAAPPAIVTSVLPNANAGQAYAAQLVGTGGIGVYTWSATGLPTGFSINPATGLISGTTSSAGTSTVTVTLRDSQNQPATRQYTLVVIGPLAILTTVLPGGVAGQAYSAQLVGTGGVGPYIWSATGLPSGFSINPVTGLISGTASTESTSTVTIILRDSQNQTASRQYPLSVIVLTPPLNIGGGLPNGQVGVFYSGSVFGTGGTGGYAFTLAGGSLPGGVSLTGEGFLNGTPTAPGTFRFTIRVTDSSGSTATRDYSVQILPPPLAVTGTVSDVPLGSPMNVQFGATGGVPPYNFSIGGGAIPSGTRFTNGTLSGTPVAMGTFEFSIAVTDSAGTVASKGFTIRVTAPLLDLTGSAGNGQVGVPYSAVFGATGGTPPYTFTASGLPPGLSLQGSTISGTPSAEGTFQVGVTVTDSAGARATKTFSVVIAPAALPPLQITPASLPAATVGAAYTASLSATGGVPPYTWSASGLPVAIALSTGGTFSGAPAAPGSSSVTVAVTDNAGNTATRNLTLSVGLPATPPVNVTGLPPNSNPGTQQQFQIGLGTPYPGPVTVVLTLTFAADTGPDDPAVQFQSGGRTATLMIPAGSSTTPNVGIQTGTVAGTATITARLTAFSSDITPAPPPTQTIRINSTAPVISSATATRNATGFTVTISGFASSREITQAIFTFTAATGADLRTTELTVNVESLFAQWFASAASAPFGSQFTLTLPFTVQGDSQAIVSLTVRLVSRAGTSAPATANLQ